MQAPWRRRVIITWIMPQLSYCFEELMMSFRILKRLFAQLIVILITNPSSTVPLPTMDLYSSWITPDEKVVKINVHTIVDAVNNFLNSTGQVARDHYGAFLWGIMGPFQGMSGLQAQVWAIHKAIKMAVERNIAHIHVETDNAAAFDALDLQNDAFNETEGITLAVQQINILFTELNRVFEDGSKPRSCKISSAFASRNTAARFLAEYGLNHCQGLVEVPVPFGNLNEILDLDNGLGPHSPVFDVAPNFGLGELNHISSMESQATIPGSYVHVSEPLFRALVSMALENSMPPQENNLMNTGFNAVTHHQDFLSSPNATGDLLALQAPLNLIHPSSQVWASSAPINQVANPNQGISIREPQQNGQTLPPNSLDKGKGKMLYVLDDDDDDLLGSSFPDL